MVVKYIVRGLEEIEKAYGEESRFTEIIQYIKNVEDFKHCTDEIRAAGLLEMHKLTLDHVPGHLLKSKEVIPNKTDKLEFIIFTSICLSCIFIIIF